MPNIKTMKIIAPIIALTAVLLTIVSIAALSASRNVDLNGKITAVNVELYHDSECMQPCSNINVGTLNPGSAVTQAVYVKNTGTVPVALSMTTSNWSPTEASNCLTLLWNRENYVLNAGMSCEATLTLVAAVNTDSLTTFSFSATITGTQ